MVELTAVEQKIFDKVMKEWKKRGMILPTPADLKEIIKLANTDGDGYKRVSRIGEDKTFLVPIEDIILHGIKATELDKYPIEKKQ